ncbi:MAG TPA: 16S rRNA (cytidine(1402)-2'-O)-methyltransferase [Vicinamibacterales bacterium]|nr:16S rRNA (cytidine(1402)-2'-O)-methyltransferase [Vicinamibacterales bacterium]
MPGRLYVVSTPIGNLEDITLRALSTLKEVGLIAAEDTRRTGILLRHFGITTPTTSLHEHNERQKLPQLLDRLTQGTDLALVSDAGTPLVADPGQRLTAAAIERGFRVIPIPGASAVLAALAASGFPGDQFVFAGFAPSRSNNRKKWLSAFLEESRVVIFYEAPHRISKTLADITELLGDRPIIIGRELTKLHEEIFRTTAAEALTKTFVERGEFTVVLGPYVAPSKEAMPPDEIQVEAYFYRMTKSGGLSRRQALSQTADKFGLSTNDLYAMLERLKAFRHLDRGNADLLP